MTLQPKSTTTDDSESEKIDGYLHMIKYTTHYLELQMIVYLAIWFIIGYLQKHICLNPKVHHKQNRTFMIHYAAQDHRKRSTNILSQMPVIFILA